MRGNWPLWSLVSPVVCRGLSLSPLVFRGLSWNFKFWITYLKLHIRFQTFNTSNKSIFSKNKKEDIFSKKSDLYASLMVLWILCSFQQCLSFGCTRGYHYRKKFPHVVLICARELASVVSRVSRCLLWSPVVSRAPAFFFIKFWMLLATHRSWYTKIQIIDFDFG